MAIAVVTRDLEAEHDSTNVSAGIRVDGPRHIQKNANTSICIKQSRCRDRKRKDGRSFCGDFTQICVSYPQICVEFTQRCAYHKQMLSSRITFADLAAVGRMDRHRLRNLLKDLPEFARRPANERVASEYTHHDLMVVAILCELDHMGFRKEAIAKWVSPIQQVLLGPRSIAVPQLFLTCEPYEASLVDEHFRLSAGVVVDLDNVLGLVDNHCAGLDGAREQQRELEFGPTSVGRSKIAAGQTRGRSHG